MNLKQKFVDFYNQTESWISGLFFVIYGMYLAHMYQIYQNADSFNDFLKNNYITLIVLALIFFLFLSLAIRLKNGKTTTELNLEKIVQDKEQKISELEENLEEAQTAITEIRDENLNDLFILNSEFLRFLSLEFAFSHDDRISLYLHDHTQNHFILLARYSSNTNFCKRHRKTFPDNEGVLGYVWQGKYPFYTIYELPHTTKKFIIKCAQLGMEENIAKNLSMKSTELIVYPIINNGANIGVVIIESIRKQGKKGNPHYLTSNKEQFKLIIQKNNLYLIELTNFFIEQQSKLINSIKVDENE